MTLFKKGQSGNPKGRPMGSKTAGRVRELLSDPRTLEPILKSLIESATQGDTAAQKLILDRICPTLKPQSEIIPTTLTII